MAYRHDIDLEFLDRVKHDDLERLAYILTHDPQDNETRWTQELTKKLAGVDDYHYRWHDIAGELQCYGANTFATFFRGGKGVKYREILLDVCEKCKVKIDNKEALVGNIESQLLAHNASQIWEKLPSDAKTLLRLNFLLLDPSNKNFSRGAWAASSAGTVAMFYTLLSPGLGSVMAPLIASQTARLVSSISMAAIYGPTSSMLTGFAATRLIPGLNPISLLPAVLHSLAEPAYRVTIPACLCIAELRKSCDVKLEAVLEAQKWEEIARKLQEAWEQAKKSERIQITRYVFGYKALEDLLGVIKNDIIEDLKFFVYGVGDDVYFNSNKVNDEINNNDFVSSYRLAREAGTSEKLLKEYVLPAACRMANKSDQYNSLLEKLN